MHLRKLRDVITVGPDYATGRVAFELYNATANVGFRTIFDFGDALELCLRIAWRPARVCATL
jgi:hypothetical protein